MADTIFDKIVRDEIDAYKVWEDENFLAFLTPFPNTPGLTVVIPKHNPGDYIFNLNDDLYSDFLLAVKKVSHLLEKALNVDRVGLVFEGTGVAYVHAKLYPFHGPLASQTDVWSDHTEFTEEYKGYFSTVEGPRMDDERLREIQAKVLAAGSQQG
jgi:diadenosine tetraphosphate (Ap4A) HIT family hydrolase